jgi:crotonobetainyl-CoA:carnitine CoA-transferase CaiB-like acyl-CoA transferase
VAGPFAGRPLGDLGAERDQDRGTDPLRSWGRAAYRGRKLWWPVHARGKRLVTLNLRSAAGQELYLRLVERADPPHEWLNVKIIESGDLERNRSPDDPLIRGQRSNSEARKDL